MAGTSQGGSQGHRSLEIQELSVTPEGKKALLDSLNQKRIERTQVADRMIVIMNAYQAKGGYRPTEATSVQSQAFNSISRNWVSSSRLWSWATSEEEDCAGQGIWLGLPSPCWPFALRLGGWAILPEKALDRAADNSSEILRDFLVNALRKVVFFIGIIVALDAWGFRAGPSWPPLAPSASSLARLARHSEQPWLPAHDSLPPSL